LLEQGTGLPRGHFGRSGQRGTQLGAGGPSGAAVNLLPIQPVHDTGCRRRALATLQAASVTRPPGVAVGRSAVENFSTALRPAKVEWPEVA
jgi:hypothetical protein